MTITENTATKNTANSSHRRRTRSVQAIGSARSATRLIGAAIAAVAMTGISPGLASAQADSFVDCIPSEYESCSGVDVPEDPNPMVVVDDLVFCSLDIDGANPCPDEDPDPETPFEGPGDLVDCGLDMNGQDPCDEDEPDPGNPLVGPGDLVACGLDDDGQNTCPPGEDDEDGGIDEPVAGDPTFTG